MRAAPLRPQQAQTSRNARWEQGLVLMALVLFAAVAALPVYMIPLHLPRNYNEGWNAYFAAAAINGGVLYPAADATMANNYPPLSFFLVGMFGWLLGDQIIAGRIIALLSLLWTAWNTFELGRWLGADRRLAAMGGAWFLLAVYVLRPGYIAVDDPQFLALALVSSGAVIFLKAAGPGPALRVCIAVLLFIAGGLVKPNVIALPVAVCAWAAWHDRRRLGLFLAFALLWGGVVAGLLYWGWRSAVIDNVLFQVRRASWLKSIAMTVPVLHLVGLYTAMGLAGTLLLPDRERATLVLAFLLCSAATGFWMLSGAGVNYNVLFDFMLALGLGCVAFVLGLQRFGQAQPALRTLAMSAAVLSLVAFLFQDRKHPYAGDIGLLLQQKEWSALVDQVAHADGAVACEQLSICYWAHKPMEVDFFNYGEKLAIGVIPDTEFRQKVGSRYYSYVLIDQASLRQPRLPEDTIAWLLSNYSPVRSVAGQVLLLAPAR